MLRERTRADYRLFGAILGVLFVATVLVLWLLIVQPILHAGRQVRNVADFQVFAEALNDHRDEHGVYPADLGSALDQLSYDDIDSWGHPLLYLSDGEMFVLVSCGKDGRPDGTNYIAVRGEERRPESECSDVDVDQVLTDLGWYRACGK